MNRTSTFFISRSNRDLILFRNSSACGVAPPAITVMCPDGVTSPTHVCEDSGSGCEWHYIPCPPAPCAVPLCTVNCQLGYEVTLPFLRHVQRVLSSLFFPPLRPMRTAARRANASKLKCVLRWCVLRWTLTRAPRREAISAITAAVLRCDRYDGCSLLIIT